MSIDVPFRRGQVLCKPRGRHGPVIAILAGHVGGCVPCRLGGAQLLSDWMLLSDVPRPAGTNRPLLGLWRGPRWTQRTLSSASVSSHSGTLAVSPLKKEARYSPAGEKAQRSLATTMVFFSAKVHSFCYIWVEIRFCRWFWNLATFYKTASMGQCLANSRKLSTAEPRPL